LAGLPKWFWPDSHVTFDDSNYITSLQIPNDGMYWVVTTIVSEPKSDIRAKIIKHFIEIASE